MPRWVGKWTAAYCTTPCASCWVCHRHRHHFWCVLKFCVCVCVCVCVCECAVYRQCYERKQKNSVSCDWLSLSVYAATCLRSVCVCVCVSTYAKSMFERYGCTSLCLYMYEDLPILYGNDYNYGDSVCMQQCDRWNPLLWHTLWPVFFTFIISLLYIVNVQSVWHSTLFC